VPHREGARSRVARDSAVEITRPEALGPAAMTLSVRAPLATSVRSSKLGRGQTRGVVAATRVFRSHRGEESCRPRLPGGASWRYSLRALFQPPRSLMGNTAMTRRHGERRAREF
jgi:hypothetical protein